MNGYAVQAEAAAAQAVAATPSPPTASPAAAAGAVGAGGLSSQGSGVVTAAGSMVATGAGSGRGSSACSGNGCCRKFRRGTGCRRRKRCCRAVGSFVEYSTATRGVWYAGWFGYVAGEGQNTKGDFRLPQSWVPPADEIGSTPLASPGMTVSVSQNADGGSLLAELERERVAL